MTNVFVLMTAMPPTVGHLNLIKYAYEVALTMDGHVTVIHNTQPGEPMLDERRKGLSEAVRHEVGQEVRVLNIHRTLPQEPSGHEGFWDMWRDFLFSCGFVAGDVVVASEIYGKTLAEVAGGKFFPYDIDRVLLWSKATDVRREPRENFSLMLPQVQNTLRKTITIFGAESTGKTTLSRRLASELGGHWSFEWARPYLETVGTEITVDSMTDIWYGQKALQEHVQRFKDKPFIVQDTDLWSTQGYWEFWEGQENVPHGLILDAYELKSDLYLITQSNIPFEKDPIRYGGDKREFEDERWINFCEDYELPYRVLKGQTVNERLIEARTICEELFDHDDRVLALGNYIREGQ